MRNSQPQVKEDLESIRSVLHSDFSDIEKGEQKPHKPDSETNFEKPHLSEVYDKRKLLVLVLLLSKFPVVVDIMHLEAPSTDCEGDGFNGQPGDGSSYNRTPER